MVGWMSSRTIVAAAAVSLTVLVPAGGAGAEGPELPGMCNGVRNAPLMVLTAHANGSPKFVLNLETDSSGAASGVMVVGKGADRLRIDQFCRFWQHLPGMEPGGGGHEPGEGHDPGDGHVPGDEAEEATIAHAVGIGALGDGTRVLVRTDVRGNEEGNFFRVRFRAMGQHGGEDDHDAAAAEGDAGDTHEDEAWTMIPAEGWASLKMLKLRPAQ